PRLRRLANVAASLQVVRTDWKLPSGSSIRMPRALVALAALVVAVTLVPAPHAARPARQQYVAPAGSGALFLLNGHGWGHGVGMGQWGAQGYALQGYTPEQILAAYYLGTTIGQTTATSIRVLLACGKKQLTIS